MITALLAARRREGGAIALATLAFMIGAGLTILITLWGIAYVTGAYNALYAANQSAAYAAATVTRAGDDPQAVGLEDQLQIACKRRGPALEGQTICVGSPDDDDEAIDAAQAVLAASLGPSAAERGPFGLYYDKTGSGAENGSVRLVGAGFRPDPDGDVITIYEIQEPPANARLLTEARGLCGPEDLEEAGYFIDEAGAPHLVCWRLRESGVSYPPQFRTGVITRAVTEIPMLPVCGSACGSVELRATAAATLDRPTAPRDWSRYYAAR